jgi:hypothetical protein
MLRQVATELPRARLAVIDPKHMARDGIEPPPGRNVPRHIRNQPLQHLAARERRRIRIEKRGVDACQNIRRLIRRAPQHHTVDVLQMLSACFQRLDAAIEHDGEFGPRGLEPVDARIIERRNLAVFLRREPVQPGLARVHDERRHARACHRFDEAREIRFAVLVVDADPALDCHRDRDARRHSRNACGDEIRLRHQARAEPALLHARRRTADVEIDFVVAERLADRSRVGKLGGIRPAELQRERMLLRAEPEQPVALAVDHGLRRHHLRIEARMPRHLAVEEPAMPVRPIHHRGDAEPMCLKLHIVQKILKGVALDLPRLLTPL